MPHRELQGKGKYQQFFIHRSQRKLEIVKITSGTVTVWRDSFKRITAGVSEVNTILRRVIVISFSIKNE